MGSTTMVLPVRRLGEEEFRGEGGRLLLAGNALHADLAPEAAGSGGFGWLMSMLGQTYGFPVPADGSGALTTALAHRLARRGGTIRCGEQVTEVAWAYTHVPQQVRADAGTDGIV